MKISIHWLWYDFWIGLYWDRENRTAYICPLPTVVIKVDLLSTSHRRIVKMANAYCKYADKLGKTTEQLTTEEKQVALLNAVMEKAEK